MSDVQSDLHKALVDSARSHNDKFAAQGKGETRDAYLRRLINATSELSDDDFKALPPGAQGWFNRCANAFNEAENPTIPDLEGFDGADPGGEQTQQAAAEGDVADKKPRGRGRKPREGVEGAQQQRSAAPASGEVRLEKKKGVVRLVREFMIANPKASNEDLMKQCQDAGLADVKLSSVSLTRVDALAFFRVLRDMGKLPEGMELPPDRGQQAAQA